MQRLMFIRPARQERANPPQELKTILVTGKRKPFIKKTLAPVAPRIGGKVYHSTAQVRSAVAQGRIAHNLIERAFAEVAAYEKWFALSEPVRTYPYFCITKDSSFDAVEVQSITCHDALNGQDTSGGFMRAKPANKAGTPRAVPVGIYRKYVTGKRRK